MNTNDTRGQVIPHVQQTYNSPSHCDGLRQRFHEFWTQLPAYKCLAIRNWDQEDSQQGPSTYSPARRLVIACFTAQIRRGAHVGLVLLIANKFRTELLPRLAGLNWCYNAVSIPTAPISLCAHQPRTAAVCFDCVLFDVFWSLLKVRRSIKGT